MDLGRREKGEGRRENGERRREKGEERREKGDRSGFPWIGFDFFGFVGLRGGGGTMDHGMKKWKIVEVV
jgi:hypothetical protein